MNRISSEGSKRGKLLYIFEAGLEYLISILVTGSFLATLTRELGFSDSLTGILSSVISLGCLFQLLSLSFRTKEKRYVTILSIINQVLFMLLYVVPLTDFAPQVKTVIFVVLIVLAYLFYNLAHPKKISWMMSFVEDRHRGQFTATKEITSLLSGMAFSFGMGSVIDYFAENGNKQIAFALSAGVIFVLMILHALTLFLSAESKIPTPAKKDFRASLSDMLKNKKLLQVSVVFVLHNISIYIATPFYGTYQINELGLNLKFISAIVMCGSISRILVSVFWGKYADRKSFAAMIEKCFFFLGLARICVVFAVPSNGKLMFALYYLLQGIANGGINSALMNLIFDYVPLEKRADSLAINQAISGLVGFLTTLCVSPLVSHIQSSGNQVFGLPIYAQQLVSLFAFLFTVLTVIYVRVVFMKKK